MTTLSTYNPLPESWMEKLFKEMALTYGKRFTDQWQGLDPKEMKAHWAQQLAHLSREELAAGVAKMRSSGDDWPPALPAFIAMCRPPVDVLKAYYEAVAGVAERSKGNIGRWSHPAIYWAAVGMAYELKQNSYSSVKSAWESALSRQLDRGSWEPIPEPSISLPPPKVDVEARSHVERVISAATQDNADGLRWAKRIMERHNAGDKTLTAVQVVYAKEALKIRDS